MKNLILLTILSLTLTACNSDSATTSEAPATTSNNNSNTAPIVDLTCATDITTCTTNTNSTIFADTLETITPEMQTAPANIHASLAAAATADATVTLPAIAVLFTDSTVYTRGNALLPWEVDGNLNPVGLDIARTANLSRTDILGDLPYPTVTLTFDGTNPIDATINADETYAGVTATTDVNAILGFASDDIAYIEWAKTADAVFNTETPSKYSKQGMAIAGVETTNYHIQTAIGQTGEAVFTGKGRGYERLAVDNSLNYLTFTATATVNFASNATFTLASTASMACDADFANCSSTDSKYNFTSETLGFTGNNISGAINNSDSSYTGVADARFYSTKATDLAGSFAMNDANNNYYYGVFGGERSTYFVPLDKPTSFNANSLVSFDDTNRNGTQDNQLPALFVEITRQETGTNAVTTVSDNTGTVEFDYQETVGQTGNWGSPNDIASDPVIFYFADKRYAMTQQAGSDAAISLLPFVQPGDAQYVSASDGIKPSYIVLDRSTTPFKNFTAQYMAVATWWVLPAPEDAPANTTLPDIDYKSYGYGITGFETAGTSLPSSDISFTNGRGFGRYGNADAIITTSFNVTANVNASNRTVTLASDTTCTKAGDCSNTLRPDLEFTATLGYAENSNVLSTANTGGVAFSTAGGVYVGGSSTSLTGGTVEARFYGPNTEEIGGTFNASNATSGYVGYFGAKKNP